MSAESRVTALEAEVTTIKLTLGSQFADLEKQKVELLDQLNLEFTQQKLKMHEVVEHARAEFDIVRTELKQLHDMTAMAIDDLKKKVEGMDRGKGQTAR